MEELELEKTKNKGEPIIENTESNRSKIRLAIFLYSQRLYRIFIDHA